MKKISVFLLLFYLLATTGLSPRATVLQGQDDPAAAVSADIQLVSQSVSVRYSALSGLFCQSLCYRFDLQLPLGIEDLSVQLLSRGKALSANISCRDGLAVLTFDPVGPHFVPEALRFYRGDTPVYYLPLTSPGPDTVHPVSAAG